MSHASLEYSVKNALESMELTDGFKKFITGNRESWSTFGKMDSHLYRKKLMALMNSAGLTKEQKLVVYFFFAVVKKKSRVIEGLNGLSDSQKTMGWYEPVKTFVATVVTDYNTASKSPDKFPGTHIPTTNPGLDLLLWRLMTPKKDRSLDAFFARTTSVQLCLNRDTQEMAKSGYKLYWDEVVKGTKNTANTEEAKYREDYYNTSAGDMYNLVEDNLSEVEPADKNIGYTREEITAWMNKGA